MPIVHEPIDQVRESVLDTSAVSYIDMRAYGGPVVQRRGSKNASRNASGDRIPSLQPVASHASLLSLAGVLADEYDDNRDEHYD